MPTIVMPVSRFLRAGVLHTKEKVDEVLAIQAYIQKILRDSNLDLYGFVCPPPITHQLIPKVQQLEHKLEQVANSIKVRQVYSLLPWVPINSSVLTTMLHGRKLGMIV